MRYQETIWTRLVTAFCAFGLLLLAAEVTAQEKTLSGRWQASAMTVRWRIGEWGDACGPKPGGGGKGPASVLITEVGKELRITGGGESYSTGNCYEAYPGLGKRSHSAGGRNWNTVCKTSSTDPRQATVTTSISATDNQITFSETGQYQFVVDGQNCTASSGKWRKYTLIQRAGELGPAPGEEPTPATKPTAAPTPQPQTATAPAPAPKPAPKPAPPAPKPPSAAVCAKLGPIGRLDVRPSRKLMRAGDTFRFRATVADVKGCILTSKPAWHLVQPFEGAQLSPNGELSLAKDAQDGEILITVSLSGKSTQVAVDVASEERYAALLSGGTFNAEGETSDAATVIIATASIGADTAQAENEAAKRKVWFVLISGVVALVLAVGGLIIYRRHQKKRKAEAEKHSEDVERGLAEHEQAKQEAKAAHDDAVREHKERVEKEREEYYKTKPKLICPICGQKYPKGAKFCGKDGGTLVPIN